MPDHTADPQDNAIELLPTTTQTKIRSTQILTSLPQIVSELLQNSLDAGALHIEIGVDCEEWSCWVKDDGVGINKGGLSLIGKGPKDGRYITSKAYNLDSLAALETFGFRGEALASAANLSCLEISSRTSRSRESWSVIIKGGISLYNGPSIRWRRESPGTVVCIRDAFYNLPIRRLSHPSPIRTLEQIRRTIEAYALVFPSVAFSLENTNTENERCSNKGRIVKIPKTASTLAAFRHLYGRALVENAEEINEVSGDMKLDGFISLQGAHSKDFQFLYFNRHLMATCDLHRIIDIQFSSSTFMKNAYDEIGETAVPYINVRRSPRKAERKPVYVLSLTLPPQHIDNCLEPSKTSVHLLNTDAASTFLISIIRSFLIRHGFLTQEQLDRKRTRNESPSPSKRRKSNISSTSMPQNEREVNEESLYIYEDDSAEGEDGELTWKDPRTGEYFIVDTRTGNSYPRDANSLIHEIDGNTNTFLPGSSRRRTIPIEQNRTPVSANDIDGKRTAIPNWIQQALQGNTTYALVEFKIPSLFSSSLGADVEGQATAHSCNNHWVDRELASHASQPQYHGAGRGGFARQFRKEDLLNAKVINQVDRKFIACVIDGEFDNLGYPCSGQSLVLIDQHAADERVRVERFLKDLCLGFLHRDRPKKGVDGGVQTKELSPPAAVLLTRREALRLKSSDDVQAAFSSWGIRFTDLPEIAESDLEGGVDANSITGYVQVLVRSIPEIVSEKLLLGEELRELIKGFLAKLETDTPALRETPEDDSDADEEFSWLVALRWCPRELLDLVNSKACRGAIMFNDTLTFDQCKRLVRKLSETAFPFQCAHGRPSLVPLANTGTWNNDRRHGSKIEWNKLSC